MADTVTKWGRSGDRAGVENEKHLAPAAGKKKYQVWSASTARKDRKCGHLPKYFKEAEKCGRLLLHETKAAAGEVKLMRSSSMDMGGGKCSTHPRLQGRVSGAQSSDGGGAVQGMHT
jgi:hypothetical protein